MRSPKKKVDGLEEELVYVLGLIVPRINAPVSTSTMSPEFADDSMVSADVSICPFTVLAKGRVPWGDEVNVGTQPPLEMPSALQKTRKPCRITL